MGAKTVMGMGCIYRDCETCNGVGMVKQEKLEPVEIAQLHEQIDKELESQCKGIVNMPIGKLSDEGAAGLSRDNLGKTEPVELENIKEKKKGAKNG